MGGVKSLRWEPPMVVPEEPSTFPYHQKKREREKQTNKFGFFFSYQSRNTTRSEETCGREAV